jgi:hypothetical protein
LRRFKILETTKEKRIENFKGLENYFQGLANCEEQQNSARLLEWNLGLFLVKEILRIIESDSPNTFELRTTVNILEENVSEFGSGWYDLYGQAKIFLSSVEKSNFESS